MIIITNFCGMFLREKITKKNRVKICVVDGGGLLCHTFRSEWGEIKAAAAV